MANAPKSDDEKREKPKGANPDSLFRSVVNKMLRTPPKHHGDMKVGKGKKPKSKTTKRKEKA